LSEKSEDDQSNSCTDGAARDVAFAVMVFMVVALLATDLENNPIVGRAMARDRRNAFALAASAAHHTRDATACSAAISSVAMACAGKRRPAFRRRSGVNVRM